MELELRRSDRDVTSVVMAQVTANWTDGTGSHFDDTIDNATIDNVNYTYHVELHLTPNDNVDDVRFREAMIEFTY